MLDRCYCQKDISYQRYGGRGIQVCERWRGKGALERFMEDIGPAPGPDREYSIGRIDNDGNYEPGNVEWQTRRQQNDNRGNTRFLEASGKRQCIAEWARETGLSLQTIHSRLLWGWPVESALSCPPLQAGGQRPPRILTIDGKMKTVRDWAEISGTPHQTIHGRLRRGWPAKRAVFATKEHDYGTPKTRKLARDDELKIVKLYRSESLSQRQLARLYSVSHTAIAAAIKRAEARA